MRMVFMSDCSQFMSFPEKTQYNQSMPESHITVLSICYYGLHF